MHECSIEVNQESVINICRLLHERKVQAKIISEVEGLQVLQSKLVEVVLESSVERSLQFLDDVVN